MFCCTRSSSSYEPIDTTISKVVNDLTKHPSSTVSTYPGSMRRRLSFQPGMNLVQTGGNALMAYDPETMSDLVKVVVPSDCQQGQIINVKSPPDKDGNSRMANFVIPKHCIKPGSSFLVQFPRDIDNEREDVHSYKPNDQTLKADYFILNSAQNNEVETASVDTSSSNQDRQVIDDQEDPLKEKLLPCEKNEAEKAINIDNQQHMMLITVPPGVDAGSTIYAKVPGYKKRFLPVKVPKGGVSQFYISYTFQHTITESEMMLDHYGDGSDKSPSKRIWDDNPIAYAAPMVTVTFLL